MSHHMTKRDTLEKSGGIQSKGYNKIRQELLVPERDQGLEILDVSNRLRQFIYTLLLS